jgi:hypothetical protein
MPDIIITPSSGKLEFIDNSTQTIRRHAFTLDHNDGIKLDAPLSAAAVIAPLNVINVTVNNSNVNYPFVLASGSAETGTKTLMMDGSGGTYNPFTNTATIDISGNSATTTLASNSTNLGGVAAASYVTLTGTQTLTNKTITGTFTGNLTGTGSWATNAVNANTATNSTQLNGQSDSYYTNIPARLGYTPVNKAGDTISGNLTVNGNFAVNGSVTAFSASNIYITSSNLTVTDNILLMNALSPYQRYAGLQMYDSGSNTLSQFLWDGEGDYFFLTGSSVNGKIITGPDGQNNLSSNYIPKATAGYKLGNSLLYDNGTNVGIGTTTPSGKLSTGATSGMKLLVYDNAATGVYTGLGQDLAAGNSTDLFAHSVSNLGFITFGKIGTNGSTYTEWARFNTSGSLGIGTNNPSYKLDVTGSLGVNASSADNNWPFVVSDNSSAGSRYSLNKFGSMGFNNADNYAQLQLLGSAGAYVDFTNSIGGDSNARLIYYAGSRLDLTYGFLTTITLNGTGVGIGTTDPTGELHVYGTQPAFRIQSSVSGSMQFGQWDGTYNRIQSSARDFLLISTDATNLIFSTNGTERMRILSGGNIGIGTTAAGEKITISGNLLTFGSTGAVGTGTSLYLGDTANSRDLAITRVGGSAMAIGRYYPSAWAETIRFTADGNVGIGTTVPAQKLDVVGNIRCVPASSAWAEGLSFSMPATSSWGGLRWRRERANADGNHYIGYIGTDTTDDLVFGSNNAGTQIDNNIRITKAGLVGVGTSSPVTKFHVVGVISGSSFSGAGTGLTGTAASLSIGGNAATATRVNGTNGQLLTKDIRAIAPNNIAAGYLQFGFTTWTNTLSTTPYADYLHLRSYTDSSGGNDNLVMFRKDAIGMRIWQQTFGSASNYSTYKDVAFTDQIGNGTITIAAGTGVGVGTTNIFTTNQSGATTVTISNTGVTSNVAGTGISVSGATGAVTITNSGVTSAVAGTGVGVSGATGAVTFSIGQAVGTGNSPTFAGLISSGNVGIGTTSATARLHVSGSTGGVFEVDTAGGTTNLYVSASGNIGIGTTNPVSKLDIYGPVSVRGTTVLTTNFDLNAGNASDIYGNIRVLRGASLNDGMFIGYGGAGGPIRFYSNSGTTEFMQIATSGNVGIGTTLPTSKLHIVETTATGSRIQLGSTSTNALMNTNLVNDFLIFTAPFNAVPATVSNNNAKWGIKMGGGSTDAPNISGKSACIYAVSEEDIGAGGSGAGYNRKVGLALHTSPFDLPNVERVRINNLGNVGIGSTSPGYKLDVNGTGYFSSTLQVNSNITLSGGGDVIINDSDGTGTFNSFMDSGIGYIRIDDGGSANGKLNINSGLLYVGASGGNVGIGSTSPACKLDVVGTIRSTTTEIFGFGASDNVSIRAASTSNVMGLYTSNSEKVRIDASGNVGIGTSNPGRKLDVEGIVRTRGASGTGGFEISAASSGTAKWRIEWDSASDSLDFNWVG